MVGKDWVIDEALVKAVGRGMNYGWSFEDKRRTHHGMGKFDSTSYPNDGDLLGVSVIQPSATAHNLLQDDYSQNARFVLRYCEADGSVSAAANPNGSVANVAGLRNARGNVMGLMPHPEHAVEAALGGTDGLAILGSLADALGAAS